mmetsp:Transcript_45740/g.76073  ORF Transcript_45740/g.76073 Transcript_45740/m.76073 type:complete len:171 (+) Transcript_45740:3-515(+)
MSRILLLVSLSLQLICIRSNDCDPEINCSGNGRCVTGSGERSWDCLCQDEFTSHPTPNATSPDAVYCNYKQKKQVMAFVLCSSLSFFAAGRFYAGLYLSAVLKLLFNVLFGCCGVCVVAALAGYCGDNMSVVYAYTCIVHLGILAWFITDMVLFGINALPDENGVSLEPW